MPRNPAALVAAKVRALLRVACWKYLTPGIAQASGEAKILGDSDWEVANEIFVRREYDEAILQALAAKPAGRPLRVLDLGANVGFFSIRCMHLCLNPEPGPELAPVPLELLAVEGSRRLFADLNARLVPHGRPGMDLRLKNGLVGMRSGSAMFYSSLVSSCTNSVSRGGRVSHNPFRNSYAEPCEYLDIESVLPADAEVDLIKCDIEGSERAFLESYSGLLGRTRFLAIEFHPLECDVDVCRELLRTAGFERRRVIKAHPTHSLEFFAHT